MGRRGDRPDHPGHALRRRPGGLRIRGGERSGRGARAGAPERAAAAARRDHPTDWACLVVDELVVDELVVNAVRRALGADRVDCVETAGRKRRQGRGAGRTSFDHQDEYKGRTG